jgi:tetratricopeptide (TPR) repeat protein
MVEHRMYLPSAGIFLAAACLGVHALDRLGPRARRLALGGAALYVLVLAGATHARNEIWRDPATLWGDAAAKSPRLARPWLYLGQQRMRLGDPAGAVPLFERATQLHPRLPHAFLNLGRAYAQVGRLAEAERAFRDGFAMGGGKLRRAHLWFGELLLDQGRVGEACEEFRAELTADPSGREARTNLVVCSLVAGAPAAALAEADRLEREFPGDARLLFNLALAADAAGEPARAAVAYSRFLRIADPDLAAQQEAARRWLAERGAVRP